MRKMIQNKKSGFTLIELMIVVAILGILAAVAIPAFATYVRRSKTSEVYGNLEGLFKAVSAYYNKEFTSGAAVDAQQFAHCGIPAYDTSNGTNAGGLGSRTSDIKQLQNPATILAGANYSEQGGIGFNAGTSYYVYGNTGFADSGTCAGATNTPQAYVLAAYGDLDNDDTESNFTLTTATNASNEIYKAGQTYIQNELE